MPRRRAATLLLGLVLAATAGCGSPQAVGPDRLVQLGLTEYRLMPQSIRVPAGQLTIYAHNYGRLTHNLVVTRGSRTTGSTQAIRPGETAEVVLYVSPGKYLMSSTILSDRDLGIYGTLDVTK